MNRISQKIHGLSTITIPTKLDFDTFFSNTLFVYPDEYDDNDTIFSKPAYAYVKVYDTNKKYNQPRGGITCIVCYDKKPASTSWFCRVCDAVLCAGCFKSCRNHGTTYSPESVLDLTDKNYSHRDVRATQPRCPQCRGEGTFGTKGVKCSRIKTITISDGVNKLYYSANPHNDIELRKYIKDYVAEFNKCRDEMELYKCRNIARWKKVLEEVNTSPIYEGFADDINEKEKMIKDLEQTIRDIRGAIWSIKIEQNKFIDDVIEKKEKIPSPMIELGTQEVDMDTLIDKFGKIYPRRFYASQMDGYAHLQHSDNDMDISQNCYFSRYKRQERRTGGILPQLDRIYSNVRERYDYLMTGAELPIRQAKTDIDTMSDLELEEQMKIFQDIIRKRKEGKDCGGAKAE